MAQNRRNFKFLLLDIEGTTTSINFVKDVLFKYALENVEKYLSDTFKEEETQKVIEELRLQAETEIESVKNSEIVVIPPIDSEKKDVIDSVVKYVMTLMDADAKVKPLKKLQGFIWKKAYETGAIKSHIYDDVVPALEHWQRDGKDIYIYSSGSIQAQKLLFQYSEKGDLLKYFRGHFDTSVGMKVETESYSKIARSLEADPLDIVFITDIPREALAASEAGFTAVLSERSENKPLSEEDRAKYKVIRSFEELYLEERESLNQTLKRQTEEEEKSNKKNETK